MTGFLLCFVIVHDKQEQYAAPEKSGADLLAPSPAPNQELQEGRHICQRKASNFLEWKKYEELWGYIISIL